MKRNCIYIPIMLIALLTLVFTGCGGNAQGAGEEAAQEMAPTEQPTQEVLPTEQPTQEIIPTEEPTQEVVPTEEPTEEVVPTEETFDLPEIEGQYAVVGVDPDYNQYEGAFEITAANGIFQWNWLDREPLGIGLFQEDIVSVAWGENTCNLFTYVIQEDGVLEGFWTMEESTEIGTDKSKPEGEMGEGIEGTYSSFGGSPSMMYSCILEVTRNGDVYDFYWYDSPLGMCGGPYYGVGIQREEVVSVAWSKRKSSGCTVISYFLEEDGTLDGIWTYEGTDKLGTDVASLETSD